MSTSGELETEMCKFTWNLKNFSKLGKNVGDRIISPYFTIKDLQVRILLYPYGDKKSSLQSPEYFISLYLQFDSSEELKLYYEFSLSDVTRTILKQAHTMDIFTPKMKSWGWRELIKRSSLIQKKDNLLDDTLNITCTLHMDAYHSKEVNMHKTILSNYELLFYNENFSDLIIIIDKNYMKVHKSILSARSEVFKAMFSHDMKENNTNTIKITDVSYNIMKEVLLFIYSGKVNDLHKNAKKILPPADKYRITELKILCEKSIWKNIKIEDACETLITADLYQCSGLKTKIIEFIIKNMKEVKKTPGFKNLNRSHPDLFEEIFDKVVEKKF